MAEKKPPAALTEPREGAGPLLALVGYRVLTGPPLTAVLARLDIAWSGAERTVLHGCAVFLLTLALYRRFLDRSMTAAKKDPRRFWKGFFLGCAVYWIPALLLMGLGSLAPAGRITQPHQDTLRALSGQWGPGIWVVSVLLAPLSEEVLYRGVLFSLSRKPRRWVGYLLSSLLFAAAHMLGYLSEMHAAGFIYNLLCYSAAGAALCCAYEASGSVWSAAGLHALINLVSWLANL